MAQDEENFFCRIVIGDETWLHEWDPKTKQESMGWKHTDSPVFKKFCPQSSAQNVLATIYWGCDGILKIGYRSKKSTILGEYFDRLMIKLREVIKEKRRGKIND